MIDLRRNKESIPFIETPDHIVNLANVSNINVLRDTFRIVFNMNYFIDLGTQSGLKRISDYVYWDAKSEDEFLDHLDYLKHNSFFDNNFLDHPNSAYVNKNEISSVKFDDNKFRVIFNLSHPVTFKKHQRPPKSWGTVAPPAPQETSKCTSEFVYANCANHHHYQAYSRYIKEALL